LADDSSALDSLNEAVAQTHLRGSSLWASAYTLRGCGWLWHGQLNEAQSDTEESLRIGDLTNSDVGVYAYGFLAEILLEQGQLEAAEEALGRIGATTTACPPGPFYVAMTTLSRLQRERGNPQGALNAAFHARQLCQAYDIHNTAFIGWRTEAAMALHALDRNTEARQIAAEDLTLARRWGAPRALGRALRISGILAEAEQQKISLLEQAVSTLENSPARLEHAKALADYGITLRQSGHRTEARTPLRQALELAEQCGAHPLAETARTELTAAGGRTRRTALTGPNALTPSEHRIATLAATGATNRQIAQQLYVTPKTVEVHLSATYRKLGITSRTQLAPALKNRASGER
ncbi:LuxR C-terminal-related transcriptional regulator, partial [Streptomyces sp. NPDC060085]|uniref:helix-turn-helix transcriptional regulator n=1 Tax=Streptomyces sp. NPDC060085 TaxID=3347054 RepID=UPI003661AAF2